MSAFRPNESITTEFLEAFGTTSYVNADFTKEIYKDGAAAAVTVTVTHIASGVYSVAFTPNAAGLWCVRVYPTADSVVRYAAEYRVRDAELDEVVETEDSITMQQAISVMLSALAGRTTNGGLTFQTPNGNATRITAAVNDSNERTAITIAPSS